VGNWKQKEQKINMNINKRRAEVKRLVIAAFAGDVMCACSVHTDLLCKGKDIFGFNYHAVAESFCNENPSQKIVFFISV